MLGLAFVAVGSFCKRSFASASIRSPFRLFLPLRQCPFLMRGLLRKSCTPGLPLLLPPSLRKGGMMGGGISGCPSVASRGSSSPARLLSSERGGGASWRSFGARELASVSSVHSWTGEAGVALFCYPICPGWVSLLISARPARWWGGRVFGGFLCSRLPLPPHLCTLCEVVRRESLQSSAPLDSSLASRSSVWEAGKVLWARSWGWLPWSVLLLTLSVLGWAVVTLWAWIVSFAVFPCAVAVRLLEVFGPLVVSLRSL